MQCGFNAHSVLLIIRYLSYATLGFIDSVKTRLGFRAKGRKILESVEGYQLREIPAAPYMAFFEAGKEDSGLENDRFWNIKDE